MRSPVEEQKQPWATCLFTRMVLDALERTQGNAKGVDYGALFRGVEGLEMPADPQSFLRKVANWVPVDVLGRLLLLSEEVSGEKDFGYQAARAHFKSAEIDSPSLFEILARVLNDARMVLRCSGLWGSVLTNYLTLQTLEYDGGSLVLLARFDNAVNLTVGGFSLLRGICEGFPLLYPSTESAQLIEEISQLGIHDIVREFPDYAVFDEEARLLVKHRPSGELVTEALLVPLRSESIPFCANPDDPFPLDSVVVAKNEKFQVLTGFEETDSGIAPISVKAYKIIRSGTVSRNKLSYLFEKGRIYKAPYSRFRFTWKGKRNNLPEISVTDVRSEVSELLFRHLRQLNDLHAHMIKDRIEKSRLTLENVRLREELQRECGFSGIVARSLSMHDLYAQVRSVAETDLSVLIQGETGTGKELIARAIHYESLRREKKFVAVNCGALSETLLESELFGHEKGAFTGASAQRKGIFEVADGGTLFLDEIGEITPGTQVRLLRVLQEGELQRVGGTDTISVDVRIIAATNRNLEALIKQDRFRQDLYYRLNVFPLRLPPLRERVEDIPLLVAHFIEKSKECLRKNVSGVSPQAMALLMAHTWPGNVRQLENTVQRMMVVATKDILDVKDLPTEIVGEPPALRAEPRSLKGITRESSEMIEKRTIATALSTNDGNVTRAARSLGISRVTLQKKMKIYDLRDSKPTANSG